MAYDKEYLEQAIQSQNGLVRLAAVLSTLTVEEIEVFAGEISQELKSLRFNDEKAGQERTNILVSCIAKFASDPDLKDV